MNRRAAAILAAALAVGAALRLWIALGDDGIFWPDEIFQSLEPAHAKAFGCGLIPWEFTDGARSWLLPLLLAPLMKIGALLDGDRPRGYLVLIRLVLTAISLATAWGTVQLARKLRAGDEAAALAGAAYALLPPVIFFAPRAMSECVAVLPLTYAFVLLADEDPTPRAAAIAGLLAGLATILRLQHALLCLVLVGWMVARRRWRSSLALVAALAAMALVDGALDRVTWGAWFHSAAVYLRTNVSPELAQRFLGGSGNPISRILGSAPGSYYAHAWWSACGLGGLALVALALAGARRGPGIAAAVIVFVAAHSLVGLKQLRFILVIVPLVCALAAAGLDEIAQRRRRPGLAFGGALLLLLLAGAATSRRLTFGELGANYVPTRNAYDRWGATDRALLAAHDRPDLCGLRLPEDRTMSGGLSYLHRCVPVYGRGDAPPPEQHRYNYVITVDGKGESWKLTPLGFDRCERDPGYRFRAN